MCLLLSRAAYGSRVPWRERAVKKRKAKKGNRKAIKRLAKPKNVRAATSVRRPSVRKAAVVEAPTPTSASKPKLAASSARAKAARRTAEGKFTKAIFNQIGRDIGRRP